MTGFPLKIDEQTRSLFLATPEEAADPRPGPPAACSAPSAYWKADPAYWSATQHQALLHFHGKRPADRAFHVPLAHEIVCPLTGKLRGKHDERYGAFWS